MHPMVKGGLLLALLSAGAAAVSSAQQGSSRNDTASAISEVMEYRLYWMKDSTRFNACSVFRALGEPSDFPEDIEPRLHRLLDRTTSPCGPPLPENPRVAVLSVRLDDTIAVVHTQVFKGEQAHIEDFTLRGAGTAVGGAGGAAVGAHVLCSGPARCCTVERR